MELNIGIFNENVSFSVYFRMYVEEEISPKNFIFSFQFQRMFHVFNTSRKCQINVV